MQDACEGFVVTLGDLDLVVFPARICSEIVVRMVSSVGSALRLSVIA